MLKRLTVVLFLIIFPLSVFCADETVQNKTETGFDEDYFVGLKAFDDGFYDVAQASLLDFLNRDDKSSRAGFASYLLYQMYMNDKDFKKAQQYLYKLDNFKDDRFDIKKMETDKMYLAAKIDCQDAEKLLIASINDTWFRVYLDSACPITETVIKHGIKDEFSFDTLYYLMDKLRENKKSMNLIYTGLSDKKKIAKVNNYFGHYFASNKMMQEFWNLYKGYKDSDMVSIALDYVWNQKDYPKYINLFNSDVKKEYKLQNAVYCRMIEASNQIGGGFDCRIVDGCIGKNNTGYVKTKLSCYMRNEDKKGINLFMKDVSQKEAEGLCEYARYMVGKNLYSANFLGKFSGCPDKASMYEMLYKAKDHAGIINIVGKSSGQIDLSYLAVAYFMAGKKDEANKVFAKITEPQFIEMVKARTGLVK